MTLRSLADVPDGAHVLNVQRSHDIKHRYGLLTNDAILAATMERLRVNLLACNDADFDRVAGLTVYGLP